MIFVIHEQNPQKRLIDKAVDILRQGGVIIFPTDTVYAYGCDISDKRAIEKIYWIKQIGRHKPLSFIFSDISEISGYVRNISDRAFKIMKKALPGPYTLIFKATKLVPKIAITNQKTIGVRIPNNNIALELVRTLGRPIMCASVNMVSGEYIVEPRDLEAIYRNEVDLVIDAGPKISEPSTVVDLTDGVPVIIREGKGEIFF
ncbi:MAG TPA: L-threonylcarbamoyladenylate synthase [Spirochaetota bacterium]|nr:L-threonylcarbamoyladenylate synthase [Spirochaetota bacterium]HPG52515.1 L-threonylcarbamoyladenylate synthase [Spirochaetota bacterium]HPN11715.1 L-threonylcarbamoyladenylate synthase [Spirochaetota bacterium]HQL80800.1 L-threonylcarbamoyladenylate synthase [Spirochaetota bacterium]